MNNFYEVSFGSLLKDEPTDQATVTLYKVINNTRTAVGSAIFPAPGVDTWFSVKIIRIGDRTTIDVNGVALPTRVTQSELGAGKIGVIGRFNNVAFDEVRVSIATYLFSSGFGHPSVTQGQWQCPEGAGSPWHQTLVGLDEATGFTWPPNFWGVPIIGLFNTTIPCNEAHANYVLIDLPSVTGPSGTMSKALLNNVLNISDSTWDQEFKSGGARLGVTYRWDTAGAGPRYYIRRWLKYPANLMQQMPNNKFINQHEYKTVNCSGSPGRLTIQWRKNVGWSNHYRVVRDTNNNCPGAPDMVIWERYCSPTVALPNCPATVPSMPLGQWFYDEFYVHHSLQNHNPQDRVADAINGQVVFDINMATMDENTASNPPREMKMTPGYLHVDNMQLLVDDLEVLDQIPCATFPCGPPTHY